MTYFVEYRRALGALRVTGIILGILLLLAVITRVAVHTDHPDALMSRIQSSPTAHVTRTTLPDGSVRTIVDDPVEKVHAVFIRSGSRLHLDVTQPAHGKTGHDEVFGGNMTVNETRTGNMEHAVVNVNDAQALSFGLLFYSSILIGMVVASILCGPLAKENDGHLELAWTKPVSRARYAVEAFAVDLCAIAFSQVLWVATVLLAALLFFVPHLTFEPQAWLIAVLALLGPIAWYAALTAWSASLKRGPGLVCGLGWLLALLIPALAGGLARSTQPAVSVIHAVILAVSYLDPIAYVGLRSESMQLGAAHFGTFGLQLTMACAALAALIIFYLTVAVAQWRRVEA